MAANVDMQSFGERYMSALALNVLARETGEITEAIERAKGCVNYSDWHAIQTRVNDLGNRLEESLSADAQIVTIETCDGAMLDPDMFTFNITNNYTGFGEKQFNQLVAEVAELRSDVKTVITKENQIMAGQKEFDDALAKVAKQIGDAVTTAAAKETAEIVAAIARLGQGPAFDAAISKLNDFGNNVSAAINTAVDSISKDSGADATGSAGGGTGETQP